MVIRTKAYTEHGVFNSRENAKQLIVFNGMTFGNVSPTDVDALIEYRDKAYIIFECKYRDAELPLGQKLALTRMVDALQQAGKESVLMICEHAVAAKDDVVLGDTRVRCIYYRKQYHPMPPQTTTKEMTERFINYIEERGDKH